MCRTELVGSSVAEAVNLEQGDLFRIFLYVEAPRGGERPGRPRRPEKFGRPITIRWLRMKENLAISEYQIKYIYKTFYMDGL